METAALRVGEEVAQAANEAQTGSSEEPGRKTRRRSDLRIQKAHDQAHAALRAVSSYLDADEDLPAFFLRLGGAIAEQVGARKVAFWRLGPREALTVQPTPFGFGEASPVHEMRLELDPTGDRVLEKVVFRDELDLGKGTSVELNEFWRGCGLADVKSSIAVSWRAGERLIGTVVAHDSLRGFTAGDVRVLRLAAMATGLVWQYKETEEELAQTAVRLEETVAARRRLLNNVAAGGDEARRRFASAIHEDSLQLLTAAELQLERIRADAGGSHQAVQLDQLRNTLRKVEDSLRRLLIKVSPEALELRRDIKDAIAEKLESMRLHSGIETLSDLRIPADLPDVIEALVMKNLVEALTNVEKHAHATRVIVAAEEMDGGIRVQITDDGSGFVVAEAEHLPGHLGLLAMRERAQLAGGWCHIVSEPGAGAKVDFWVPQNL